MQPKGEPTPFRVWRMSVIYGEQKLVQGIQSMLRFFMILTLQMGSLQEENIPIQLFSTLQKGHFQGLNQSIWWK